MTGGSHGSPATSEQQRLPGTGDTYLLGKTQQVGAGDKVEMRFQGLSKRWKGAIKKEKRKKKKKQKRKEM